MSDVQQNESYLRSRVEELEVTENMLRETLHQADLILAQRERKLRDQVRKSRIYFTSTMQSVQCMLKYLKQYVMSPYTIKTVLIYNQNVFRNGLYIDVLLLGSSKTCTVLKYLFPVELCTEFYRTKNERDDHHLQLILVLAPKDDLFVCNNLKPHQTKHIAVKQ